VTISATPPVGIENVWVMAVPAGMAPVAEQVYVTVAVFRPVVGQPEMGEVLVIVTPGVVTAMVMTAPAGTEVVVWKVWSICARTPAAGHRTAAARAAKARNAR